MRKWLLLLNYPKELGINEEFKIKHENTGEFVRDCAFFLNKWNSRKISYPEILKKTWKIAKIIQLYNGWFRQNSGQEVEYQARDSETIKDTTEYLMALAKSFRSLANLDLPDLADIDSNLKLNFQK